MLNSRENDTKNQTFIEEDTFLNQTIVKLLYQKIKEDIQCKDKFGSRKPF